MYYPLWFIEQMRRDAGEFDDWEEELETEPTEADEPMVLQQQYVLELDEDDIKAILLSLCNLTD